MSLTVNVDAAAPVAGVSSNSASTRDTQQSTVRCLVVAPNVQRLEMLTRAAEAAGWGVVACAAASDGREVHQRERYELAIVDLDGLDSEAATELRSLGEDVASSSALLILCGNEGDALEEIWARQQGAWLYLPGVSDASDVSSLCDQARGVVEGKLLVTEEERRSVA